jgi:hypothetical protein
MMITPSRDINSASEAAALALLSAHSPWEPCALPAHPFGIKLEGRGSNGAEQRGTSSYLIPNVPNAVRVRPEAEDVAAYLNGLLMPPLPPFSTADEVKGAQKGMSANLMMDL